YCRLACSSLSFSLCFLFRHGRPPRPTLFPYRTLFRSALREEPLEGLTAGSLSFAPDDHRSQTRYNVYAIDADGDWVFDSDGSIRDRKSTRLNSSHVKISYAVFCLKKKKEKQDRNS